MADLTPCEAHWVKIVEELRDNPAIRDARATLSDPGSTLGDAPTAFAELAGRGELDKSLHEHYLRFAELGCQWSAAEPHSVHGEFWLGNISRALPPLDVEWEVFPGGGRPAPPSSSELRVIDDGPYTGTGFFVALRLQPGVPNPELWYCDGSSDLWLLDLDFLGYFEVLGLTKGAFGWQHLFTDAPLTSEEFGGKVRRLRNMLESLPEIFPDHDYEPLRARLAERLR
ncbi:hypothetical protein [Saccharopolyspora sp. NPDC050642]|uniref:hypothetical protein n=1 Tax=Saccharopolyspora sp. NPDC050642 TaxID=3157099 RepID=UPI00340A72BC